MLEDFMAALDEEDSIDNGPAGYFLGAILLIDPQANAKLPKGPPRPFQVVDGLQRLVTLVILLCILRDLDDSADQVLARQIEPMITSPGRPEGLRLILPGREAGFIRSMVQQSGASDGMPEENQMLNTAERNILAVREHLAGELHDIDPQRRRQLAAFICEQCVVVAIATATIDRAHCMFSVLNDRGKPLARNDILKAEILAGVAERDRDHCLAVWNDIRDQLGSNFETLFSHVRTIYGRPKVQVIASVRAIVARAGGGSAFVNDLLAPMSKIYKMLLEAEHLDAEHLDAEHSGSPHSLQIRRSLSALGWMKGAEWVPPAMYWISRNQDDPERIAAFLKELERFSMCLRVLGLGNYKRAARCNAVLRAMLEGETSDPSKLPLSLKRDELRHVKNNLRNLHERNQQVCKLVLLRLSDELAGDLEGFVPIDFTVEHIIPRKPGRDSLWRKWYPNADDRLQHTMGLGNLLLVTKKQNALAGNGEFSHKHDIYFNTPEAPVLMLTETLRELEDWRPEQVQAREKMLHDLLASMWHLDGTAPANTGTGAAVPANVDA